MKYILSLLWMCLIPFSFVAGNNIRTDGKVIPVVTTEGQIQLNFSISWDNAWNDPYNWDAVWAFVKYRKKTSTDAWQHGYLSASGHSAKDLNITLGKSGDKVAGIFLSPQETGIPRIVNKGVSLLMETALLSGGVTLDDVRSGNVDFSVLLIEMVLIPEGPYYLGDGAAQKRYASETDRTQPVLVEAERQGVDVLIAGNKNGNDEPSTLSSDVPKGYRGFYAMKYELSQGQYVNFLNMLNRAQQELRVARMSELRTGDYIFGDRTRPNARNGIIVCINEADRPVIFGCNLTQDDRYNAPDDGQTLACNFISIVDVLHYCDWAGLRPMSELEFEKACHRPYPAKPLAGEYAWGTTHLDALASAGELVDAASNAERISSATKNANSNNRLGPVRCGAFAYHPDGVTQETAGATGSGMLDMSGNLREVCYRGASNYRYYPPTETDMCHGDGMLNNSGNTDISTNNWPQDAKNFILKGGGFSSPEAELQVSDRSLNGYLTGNTLRDSTVGFRAVRSVPLLESWVDPGKLVGENDWIEDTLCSSPVMISYQILNKKLPSFKDQTATLTANYRWYVKKGDADWALIPNEINESLNYKDVFENTGSGDLLYKFRREMIFPAGRIPTPEFTLRILNTTLTPSLTTANVDACGVATPVVLTAHAVSNFVWTFEGEQLAADLSATSSTFIPNRTNFEGASGSQPYDLVCEVDMGKCRDTVHIGVTVEAPTSDPSSCPCGADVVDTRDQGITRVYQTVQINTQCWMVQNMNVGKRVNIKVQAAADEPYKVAGIQKRCLGDDPQACADYGALYDWWEVVCGGQCSDNLKSPMTPKPTESVATGAHYGIKYSGQYIQGICPDGWHVPTDADWKVLEEYIGINSHVIDNLDTWGRGPAESVMKLMQPYSFYGQTWCEGPNCNTTKFNAFYGGYIEVQKDGSTVIPDETRSIRWWTSTALDLKSYVRGISWDESLNTSKIFPGMGYHLIDRTGLMYVRCLRNER